MKKALFILLALAMALASCTRELEPVEPAGQTEVDPTPVVFHLSAIHPDGAATRAVKSAWETGDVVFVFFSGQAAPAYVELKWDGTAWVNTPMNDIALSNGDTGTMTAVYLPFGSDATVVADGTDYTFDKMDYSYYLTSSMSYTAANGEVSGTFEMKIPEGFVQFFMDDANADAATTDIELREPHLTPQGIASIAADGTVNPTDVAHGAPLPGYVYDKEDKESGESKGWLFSGILDAAARNTATDYHFTVVEGGWEGSYSEKSYAGKVLYRGEQAGRALKLPRTGWTAITDYKPIDLGCDVVVDSEKYRIYWSSRNVGALREYASSIGQLSGNFYAWAETETKSDYSWGTYKYMYGSWADWKHITKYTYDDNQTEAIWYYGGNFIGDGKTVLEPADDAAQAVLKGLWRTPTQADWMALLNTANFTWTWNSDYYGMQVSSLVEGFNDGRYVFLPAGGLSNGTNHRGSCTEGLYWSSSLNMGSNSGSDIAWSVVFDQFRPRYGDVYEGFRCYGLSVRPVCGGRPQDAGSSEPVVLEHDYVDMGNGLGWATVNVGGPSDDVFGRTYLEDDLFTMGVYFDVDDPVSRLWGTPWRTPTKAEWDWLFDPDNVTWERDYNSTMMRYGWQVTSKITGKGFFFPVQSAGSFDSYWTITRHDVYPQNHWLAGFDYQNNTMSTEYFGGGGFFRAVVDLDQLPGYSPISVGDYDSWDHEDI